MAETDRLRFRPPKSVLAIASDLDKAGFEVWAVGGAVRDALLGQSHLDWDLATSATPDQVRTVFGRRRTIPVGVEFGTVGVLDDQGVLHEITTFRRDVKTDGRHAVVEFGASLDEDLARRDFTINAIAYSPKREVIHDPFGGRADLDARLVRAVGDADARMKEDRLRALRAIRFAARFGFSLDPETWDALKSSAPHLTRLSGERVKQELEKTMDQVREPSRALVMWKDSGAIDVLIPELRGVGTEVLRAVDYGGQPGPPTKPGRRIGRLAILFSDVPSKAAFAAATRLRFSKHEGQWLAAMAERWQSLGEQMSDLLRKGDGPEPRTVRRWIAAIGRPMLPAYFRLAGARWSARRELGTPAPAAQAVHSLYRRCLRAIGEAVDLRDLSIDGDDLRREGIAEGPEIGKILSYLLDLVIDDPSLNEPARLLAEARRRPPEKQ